MYSVISLFKEPTNQPIKKCLSQEGNSNSSGPQHGIISWVDKYHKSVRCHTLDNYNIRKLNFGVCMLLSVLDQVSV
jgi:hypothetical protein